MKKTGKIILSVIGFLLLFGIVVFLVYEVVKPLDPWITVSGLEDRIEHPEKISILVETDGESCWIKPSDALADLLSFADWKRTYTFPEEKEPLLTMEFQEVLELYPDGQVVAYNGYGRLGTAWDVSYKVPDGIVDRVMDYVKENSV